MEPEIDRQIGATFTVVQSVDRCGKISAKLKGENSRITGQSTLTVVMNFG